MANMIEKHEDAWGMRSAGALINLPSTGASVLRWKQPAARPFELNTSAVAGHLLLTMVVQPMQAVSYVDGRELWCGDIDACSTRVILPPKSHVGFESHCAFDLLHIHLPEQRVDAMAKRFGVDYRDLDKQGYAVYHADEVGRFLCGQFVAALEQPGAAGAQYSDSIVQMLVAHLLRRCPSTAVLAAQAVTEHPGLRAAYQCIEERAHESLSVAQLAAMAGMSEFHFARQFKQCFDATPHAHLVSARLRQAKLQLELSNKSVLQVAMDCGFANSSHFARLFRKAEGLTPQAYRQRLRLLH